MAKISIQFLGFWHISIHDFFASLNAINKSDITNRNANFSLTYSFVVRILVSIFHTNEYFIGNNSQIYFYFKQGYSICGSLSNIGFLLKHFFHKSFHWILASSCCTSSLVHVFVVDSLAPIRPISSEPFAPNPHPFNISVTPGINVSINGDLVLLPIPFWTN